MSAKKGNPYSEKHASDSHPDPIIEKAMQNQAANQQIPCALAMEMAKHLGVTTHEIGRTADLLNISVVKCQLGLFGYQPEKKIVKAEDTTDPNLKNAILGLAVNSRLSCANAWKIASQFNVSRLMVSNISQANRIQIKNCQLGAF